MAQALGSKTGFAFRRQLVIGEHIVDFACTKVRLVVEVRLPPAERQLHLPMDDSYIAPS